MKAVGVKQLKAKLSEYLRLVRGGDTILVTDRDEVVAELRPARRQAAATDSLEELFDSLAERGEITRSCRPKRRWKWKAKGLGLATGTANALLSEVRSDR
ncbi:MAG: type II toxin-antitoxin system Phd/YefM family antitoxin [Methylacidiphilaceae bacterium]|nr:type II toxin-antitoxin system Phd/YefM family antitoxin [Candidatus Methylacidiphilaceae bacterium]